MISQFTLACYGYAQKSQVIGLRTHTCQEMKSGGKNPALLSPLSMLFLCTTLDKEGKKKKKEKRKSGKWCPELRVQTPFSPEILDELQEELSQQNTPGTRAGWSVWVRASFVLKSLLPPLAIFNDSPPCRWSLVFSWKTHGRISYLKPKGM